MSNLTLEHYLTPLTIFTLNDVTPGDGHESTRIGAPVSFAFGIGGVTHLVLDYIPGVLLKATPANFYEEAAATVKTVDNYDIIFDVVEITHDADGAYLYFTKRMGDDYMEVYIYNDHAESYISFTDNEDKYYEYTATIPSLTLSTLFLEANKLAVPSGTVALNINDDKYIEVQRRYLDG